MEIAKFHSILNGQADGNGSYSGAVWATIRNSKHWRRRSAIGSRYLNAIFDEAMILRSVTYAVMRFAFSMIRVSMRAIAELTVASVEGKSLLEGAISTATRLRGSQAQVMTKLYSISWRLRTKRLLNCSLNNSLQS